MISDDSTADETLKTFEVPFASEIFPFRSIFQRLGMEGSLQVTEIPYGVAGWDIPAMLHAYPNDAVLFSRERINPLELPGSERVEELVLMLDQDCLFRVEQDGWAQVLAKDPRKSRFLALEMISRFGSYNRPKEDPSYRIICWLINEFYGQTCPLEGQFLRNSADLEKVYGRKFRQFDEEFKKKLIKEKTGLVVFYGEPGTGKTAYLRHLIYHLRHTHLFYTISAGDDFLLSADEDLSFFTRQKASAKGRRMVLCIDNADAWLENKDELRSEAVAKLLDITDGLMGDFLEMQVLLTVNSTPPQWDPAFHRPGRLLACREFC